MPLASNPIATYDQDPVLYISLSIQVDVGKLVFLALGRKSEDRHIIFIAMLQMAVEGSSFPLLITLGNGLRHQET